MYDAICIAQKDEYLRNEKRYSKKENAIPLYFKKSFIYAVIIFCFITILILTIGNVATHRNTVAKHTWHVAPNNVGICCVDMLRSFGRGFTLWDSMVIHKRSLGELLRKKFSIWIKWYIVRLLIFLNDFWKCWILPARLFRHRWPRRCLWFTYVTVLRYDSATTKTSK